MWDVLLLVGLGVLFVSNIWLLREVDRLQGRLEHYVAAVRLLDDRVQRLAMEMDEGLDLQLKASISRLYDENEP